MPSRPRTPAYTPSVGEIVRDLGHRDTSGQPVEAVYMDTLGGLVYLRHETGGCEWTTKPQHVQRLDEPRHITVQTPSRPRSAGAA
ncbi:hypothetical protein ACFP3U_27160 [Kitasatospora misakiensis]|uniref:DUF4926 domain-containing protein n=1 Tax=Kitasatospora misakiensis TaxID=67330 RepID=A0ABW0X9Z2_9ACTN